MLSVRVGVGVGVGALSRWLEVSGHMILSGVVNGVLFLVLFW